MDSIFDIERIYAYPLNAFKARLVLKHYLKGTTFRKKTFEERVEILKSEIEEMWDELYVSNMKFAEEVTDVMISCMMILDGIIRGDGKFKERASMEDDHL